MANALESLYKAEGIYYVQPIYKDVKNSQQYIIQTVECFLPCLLDTAFVKQSSYPQPDGGYDIYVRKELVRSPLVHMCRLVWGNGDDAAHDTQQVHEQKHACRYGT